MDKDKAKTALYQHLQSYLDEHEGGSLLTKCFCVLEVQEPDKPRRTLSYRTVDLNGEYVNSWDCMGLIESARDAVKVQSRDYVVDVEDEEENGDES